MEFSLDSLWFDLLLLSNFRDWCYPVWIFLSSSLLFRSDRDLVLWYVASI
ncbi:unnamed protein product [Arabidopsis lyrata]|nr:unnamed protein product [Arabidopsis lyrata]